MNRESLLESGRSAEPAYRRRSGPWTTAGLVAGIVALGGLTGLGSAAVHGQDGDLSELAARGQQIFLQGTSDSGEEIVAVMGGNSIEIPASALPCSSCHGRDGRGRAEGGVQPSNLTWPELTKPYGQVHESGRRHPPYSEHLVIKAITMGVDPAGNELHIGMPRYRLSRGDADALVAYLKRLGTEKEPGVSDDTLRIGTLLPPGTSAFDGGLASTLEAYFAKVNAAGGAYGRQLELVPVRWPGPGADRQGELESRLVEADLFALLSPWAFDHEAELAAAVEKLTLPTVGAFVREPPSGFPINRYLFALLPGSTDQARALIKTMDSNRDKGLPLASWGLVSGSASRLEKSVEAALREASARKMPEPKRWTVGSLATVGNEADSPTKATNATIATIAKAIRTGEHDAWLFLVEEPELVAILEAARQGGRLAGDPPSLFVPASTLGSRVFRQGDAESADLPLTVAMASLPGSGSLVPAAIEELAVLTKKFGMEDGVGGEAIRHPALASARTLVEGLLQAGHELTRETLVERIEGFYAFSTGYGPPLTFGPNRRVGARGAFVVRLSSDGGRVLDDYGWVGSD